jgi:hypothetical protein
MVLKIREESGSFECSRVLTVLDSQSVRGIDKDTIQSPNKSHCQKSGNRISTINNSCRISDREKAVKIMHIQ